MNEVKRILNFWKEVNLLTPVTVKSIAFKNQESLSAKDVLKVPYNRIEDSLLLNNDKKYEIEIGFGDIKNTYLYEKGNIEKEDFVDGDGGESFIFAFKIDGDKKYKEESFTISKFAYILLKNIISKDYNDIEYEIKKFNENIEIDLKSYENYNVDNIKKITSLILKELNIDSLDEKILKKSFYLKLFKSNEEEDPNESSFCQMDFYTRDLETIAKVNLKDDSLLSNIIYPKENKNRQKIDDSKEFLEEITLPENMPIGKWPSKYNPSLMQAAAINICTSKEYSPNIFSVNGPPGTGKTTLLKEIIADTIVKKAKIIADLNSTDLELIRTNTTNPYYRNYYKIPDELKKLGIIVSSNNNSAVENISKDLPKAEDVLSKDTLTNLFDVNEQENIYFTKDSENIFGDNPRTWGLISAPYGKKQNIQKILAILPEKTQKNEEFNFSFGENIPDFKEAVSIFKEKYEKVLKYREDFNSSVKQFFRNKDKIAEINNSSDQISNLKNKIENLIEKLKKVQDNKEYKDSILKQKREQKSNIENSYSIFTKITNKLAGEKNPKILELNKDIEILNEELININKDIGNIENDRNELNKKIQLLENSKEILKKLEEEINMFFKTYSSNENDLKLLERCSDLENFYSDIINNEKTQESCPWGVEEFNRLREELFAYSLNLIEAYIVNSKGIKANLKLLKLLLSGENLGYSVEERKNVFKECFHTLNLLIPVLSTTFASVSKAFKDFEENELGIVIIDEAGQATPFSAMGLLYRSNRCIIVGDPLQVEPVMTVTSTLIRAIANKYELNKLEKEFNIAGKIYNYTSPSLSIQTLADYANLYYGKIGETEVGCPLVVHRRCLSPMFDISNRISYDNRMINKCMPDKVKVDYVLEKNEFIDVKGQEKGNGDHYVKEQGEEVIEIIKNYVKNNFEDNKIKFFENYKNLYVISPFTTVVNGIRNDINKAFKEECQSKEDKDKLKKWCENCLGTVHKFQGKEANSVILLLGCDNNSKSSAQWAAQAANILNVAATRAKKRFAIIGDLELWGKLNFFKDAKEVLDKFNKE
ncbi:DEAD/DEAH box helicase [Fusobacterium animalis]|uniref:DEAD/DEAH box helicase n=1 Tax=Fusobacterium animalis TaxID=76859 RepID=UPI0034DF4835